MLPGLRQYTVLEEKCTTAEESILAIIVPCLQIKASLAKPGTPAAAMLNV